MEITIEEVLDYLNEKSKIGNLGMTGSEVLVEKEMLRLAAIYLGDLMVTTGVL